MYGTVSTDKGRKKKVQTLLKMFYLLVDFQKTKQLQPQLRSILCDDEAKTEMIKLCNEEYHKQDLRFSRR
jgi:hypothetical protein